jgi:putative membrane protein
MRLHQLKPLAVVLLPLTIAAGCKMFRPIDPNGPKAEPTDTKAPATSTKAPAPKTAAKDTKTPAKTVKDPTAKEMRSGLNDPEIAAMVLAANNTDISYARLVPSRAERPDVKEFGARMLTDHTNVNGLVNDLLTKLSVAPVENQFSLDFRDESANRRDEMRDLEKYAFDSTYIENEVSYHIKFLATIDSVLIPAARNKDLKALLTAVRPAVAAHLAHAEQVRANVRSKK